MINKIFLLGRLGEAATLKATQDGRNVCTLRMATSDKYKDRNGQLQEQTEWHNVVIFDPIASGLHPFLGKGRLIHIEGKISTRSYEKDGVKHYRTEIIANSVKLCGSGNTNENDVMSDQQRTALDVVPKINNHRSLNPSPVSQKNRDDARAQFDKFAETFPGAYLKSSDDVPF